MMAERGIEVDHSTQHRWAIKLLPAPERHFDVASAQSPAHLYLPPPRRISVLTAIGLPGCRTASHIAFASAASLLFRMLNALTNSAGISFTSWSIFVGCRAQWWAPPHATFPIMHGARFAKCSRNFARLIGLFTISAVY